MSSGNVFCYLLRKVAMFAEVSAASMFRVEGKPKELFACLTFWP
jgi:hypothetical protein